MFMNKIDFEADSYRNWIKGWIKARGLTQHKFAEKFPAAVTSYPVLMSILNSNRNPTLPTFLKLFAPMKLSEEEVFFMLLLKLENELDTYNKNEMVARGFLQKIREKLTPFLRGDYDHKIPISPDVAVFIESYQLLSGKHKERVEKALETELALQAGRQKQSRDIYGALRKLAVVLKRERGNTAWKM